MRTPPPATLETKMTCQHCRDNFTEYIEEALSAEDRRGFEAHLSQCPDCRDELTDFRGFVGALRGLDAVAPPADLLARISSAVDAELIASARPGRTGLGRWSWQQVSAVAVAASLLVGFVAVFQTGLVSRGPEEGMSRPAEMDTVATGGAGEESALSERGASAVAETEAPAATDALPDGPADDVVAAAPPAATAPPGGVYQAEAARHTRRGGGRDTGRDPRRAEKSVEHIGTGNVVGRGTGSDGGTISEARENPPVVAPRRTMRADDVAPAPARMPAAPAPAAEATAVMPAAAADAAMKEAGAMGGMPGGPVEPPGTRVPTSSRPLTYAAEASAGAHPEAALVRGGETRVDFNFVPPGTRCAGREDVAAVVIQPNVEVESAVVRVTGGEGIRVLNSDPSGVIYTGRLRANQRTTVAVRVVSDTPGRKKVKVSVASTVPEANTDIDVELDEFGPASVVKAGSATEPKRDVSLYFGETNLRDAISAVGKQAGVKVDIGPAVGGRRVNAHFQDVPAEAALRILCEEGGCELTANGGGYSVRGQTP